MSIQDIANFLDVRNPPFARMTVDKTVERMRQLFKENATDVEFMRKASLCMGITAFLAEHTPALKGTFKRLSTMFQMGLTDPQKFDLAITRWCLTGEDACVRVLVNYNGPQEYKAVADWAVQDISEQQPLWAAAVARIREVKSCL